MKHETKPTNGNINLMISINEIEELLRPMHAMDMQYVKRGLKKIDDYSYELVDSNGYLDFAKLYEADLINLITIENKKGTNKSDKLRVELKIENSGYWTQDTGGLYE